MIIRLVALLCLLCLTPGWAFSAQSLADVQKAAANGNAEAANRLGVWYEKGQNGLPKDHKQAVSWYRQAAKLGNILAMHNLGDCYLQQVGVAFDPYQAYLWYKKAAEAGGAIGYEDLGNFFKTYGFGKPDRETAKIWYAQAARQGRKTAQAKLLELGGPRLAKGQALTPCPRKQFGGGALKGSLLSVTDYGPKGSSNRLLTLKAHGQKESLIIRDYQDDDPLSAILAKPSAFLGKELSLGFVDFQGLDDFSATCSTHREYLPGSLRGTESARSPQVTAKKGGDIYIAYDSLLIGAFIDKAWVDAQTLQNDAKYHAKRLWGGNSGRIYTEQGFVGEGVMGALYSDHPEEHADQGPLAEFPFFTLQTPKGDFEQEALFISGPGQDFNPLPRARRRINDNEHFATAMRNYLAEQGITVVNPHLEVFAVDFDDDGQEEYLIAATNIAESGSLTEDNVQTRLYSVLLLETEQDGRSEITPVSSYICPKVDSETYPVNYQIKMCADVNADGVLELIVYSAVREGGGIDIFSFQNGRLRSVLSQAWGV
ncbi:MAG: sel1 repeat family protein [Desulfovibrio sp.]|nr:sel1 repeat family protein [Desulfovibrio sp.]